MMNQGSLVGGLQAAAPVQPLVEHAVNDRTVTTAPSSTAFAKAASPPQVAPQPAGNSMFPWDAAKLLGIGLPQLQSLMIGMNLLKQNLNPFDNKLNEAPSAENDADVDDEQKALPPGLRKIPITHSRYTLEEEVPAISRFDQMF